MNRPPVIGERIIESNSFIFIVKDIFYNDKQEIVVAVMEEYLFYRNWTTMCSWSFTEFLESKTQYGRAPYFFLRNTEVELLTTEEKDQITLEKYDDRCYQGWWPKRQLTAKEREALKDEMRNALECENMEEVMRIRQLLKGE